MNLNEYLQLDSALSVCELRRRMVDFGSPIKSDAQIRQWQHQYASRIPSPVNCVAIEHATGGRVTRKDLRPHDWASIWPELAASTLNRSESPTTSAPSHPQTGQSSDDCICPHSHPFCMGRLGKIVANATHLNNDS